MRKLQTHPLVWEGVAQQETYKYLTHSNKNLVTGSKWVPDTKTDWLTDRWLLLNLNEFRCWIEAPVQLMIIGLLDYLRCAVEFTDSGVAVARGMFTIGSRHQKNGDETSVKCRACELATVP
jgi:hypothetical protein